MRNKREALRLPPAQEVVPVDPVGDGDSFDAGFLHQYVRGADLPTCLARGNRADAPEAFREAEHREKFLQERTTS